MPCWICASSCRSREHRFKASDAKQLFGKIDENKPIFSRNSVGSPVKIGSVNSNRLTFRTPICKECNNHRSQPYDSAWQELSRFVSDVHSTEDTFLNKIELKKVFGDQYRSKILDVYLYFVKYFGCQAKDDEVQIELSPFAEAFLQRKEILQFQLRFAEVPRLGPAYAENTQMVAASDEQGTIEWLRCAYCLDRLIVEMFYSPNERYVSANATMWTPSSVGETVTVDTLSNN